MKRKAHAARGGVDLEAWRAVVEARAVDGEEDFARVEAVDEARVGGAVWGEDGLQGEVNFRGEAGCKGDGVDDGSFHGCGG